ncbi:Alpha/Beta hydrolase protein [Podospora appendiculata]|uniref:Alpha/Beta hydrolase protein n=1 Tax=Podospora appendiculata TaxID=314037 RepID=A0AAE1CB25_9PEZI|nr:Alpha/Beta hydrolase protein [Podospora appendiculata]
MNTAFPIKEGVVGFDAPGAGKPCKTWYKVVGSLDSATPPLITLHGGPGAGHEYITSLTDLHEKHGIPVIFYDQIGCGRSTHLQEKMGDASFWTMDLFLAELDNLVDHLQLRSRGFSVLGQSWGGVLVGLYAARQPAGLRKAIIASGPASIPLYVQGCNSLLAQLPPDVRETLEDCDRRGDHESERFEKAAAVFYARHVCRLDPFPDEIQAAFKNLKEDPTSYLTIQGPSEFVIVGSIKDWEGGSAAHNIQVPTLLLNGRYDEVTDLCMQPWFDKIPRVKWVTLENASHMGHFEDRERFMQTCGAFLLSG